MSITTHHLPAGQDAPTHTLQGDLGQLRVTCFPDGALHAVHHQQLRVNQLLGDPVGGGPFRLLLRQRVGQAVTQVVQALGPENQSHFQPSPHHATWTGSQHHLHWQATLRLDPERPRWAWTLHVHTDQPDPSDDATWDAVLIQDLALAAESAAANNEKYVSQYLDLRLEPDPQHPDAGPTFLARQALPQANQQHPALLAVGSNLASAMTDLIDFFGTDFKATHQPRNQTTPTLPQAVRQHEAAAAILQSQPQPLTAKPNATAFAFALQPDHPQATGPNDLPAARNLRDWANLSTNTPDRVSTPTATPAVTPLLAGQPPTAPQLQAWFGDPAQWRHHETNPAQQTLSFFHGPPEHARHVATATKDNQLRRTHGHILRTGQAFLPDDRTLCATTYQHGVFASQLTLGNTTFGQLAAVARDPINLNQAAGLRIFVDLNDQHGPQQLTQASTFEMSPGSCAWRYQLPDHLLEIRAAAHPDAPALAFQARVLEGNPVRFTLQQHVSIGQRENATPTQLVHDQPAGTITARSAPTDNPDDQPHEHPSEQPSEQPWITRHFPDLACRWTFTNPAALDTFRTLDPHPYFQATAHPTNQLDWTLTASPDSRGLDAPNHEFEDTAHAADAYWAQLHRPISEPFKNNLPHETRLADAIPWMTQNAMIHLSVPHGLEQFGGAAWGTRDVCQGPTEFLRAIDRPDVIANVLRSVFKHQHLQTGDWPQWFMHPPFQSVQAPDSHGDVVVWPLYALCHYLEMTGDPAILQERLPYTDKEKHFDFTPDDRAETLRQHVQRALDRIVDQRIPGTTLPRYGHGDWNDSLQPAHPDLAHRMVSSWTVALLADTLQRLADALANHDATWSQQLADHAKQVRDDFHAWCMVHDPHTNQPQVAGLLLFDEAFQAAEPLLHPADQRTGIQNSLIPINRALLANLFTDPQRQHHRRIIAERLTAPDGVRLMERPPTYTGGTNTIFQRAESAAFFGREIGLMYTHAHLRTAETHLAETHRTPAQTQTALDLLNVVNPVGLTHAVPNATPRQANAYFSSSDAAFPTRYHADQQHQDVYTGDVPADGGWRIYSSGPGILLGLLRRAADAAS